MLRAGQQFIAWPVRTHTFGRARALLAGPICIRCTVCGKGTHFRNRGASARIVSDPRRAVVSGGSRTTGASRMEVGLLAEALWELVVEAQTGGIIYRLQHRLALFSVAHV
jgi:hypothetical protein